MNSLNKALNIGILGLGQAGGNIAAEFFQRGYPAKAFNTAQTDLQAVASGVIHPPLPEDLCHYIGLGDCDGAGGDVDYASTCIEQYRDLILEQTRTDFAEADALIIAAGLGGGTGSAAASFAEIIRELDKPLIGLFTLPMDSESAVTKINAVRAIKNVLAASFTSRVFIENGKLEQRLGDLPVRDFFAQANAEIVNPIDSLNELNARKDVLSLRSFDGEDLRKVLLGGGVLNYAVVDSPAASADEILAIVEESLTSSKLMPDGFESTSCRFLGLVIEAPDELLSSTSAQNFAAIDNELKSQTAGGVVFRGIYQADLPSARTTLLASSQDLPKGLTNILAQAKSEGEVLQEKLSSQLPHFAIDEVDEFALFPDESMNRASERPHKVSAENVDDKVPPPVRKKAPARTQSRRRRPGAPKRRAPDRSIRAAKTTEIPADDDTNIQEKNRLLAPGKDDEKAAHYDQLVSDYLQAESPAIRENIAQILGKDSLSSTTVIRYYAVYSMCRLGVTDFREALLAASEDENPEIRKLAIDVLDAN